jgi:hypothetical protein
MRDGDPLAGTTREAAHGYVNGNPLNRTDPSGLAWGIPDWVPVVGGGCVAIGDETYSDSSGATQTCDNSDTQYAVGQFNAGMANGLTFGLSNYLFDATGTSQHVDMQSGYFIVGNLTGAALAAPVVGIKSYNSVSSVAGFAGAARTCGWADGVGGEDCAWAVGALGVTNLGATMQLAVRGDGSIIGSGARLFGISIDTMTNGVNNFLNFSSVGMYATASRSCN